MILDWKICSRARLARDPRFDGKFFIAVKTTGIYCRPICRARTSREENILYFPTAAAAAESGFRPCLRCRPECSPGTPPWLGTKNTVSRALRLIGESGLRDGGVESLADRLGVGSRHLRRLFLRHLGASPMAVAHTRRLHFAKKLIDETRLPMTQVALSSGFGCVRQLNETIRKVYKRTPTQIRKLARKTEAQPENQYIFHLQFRPPYNWQGILAFLAARATPGVEAVHGGVYRRSFSFRGHYGFFEVSLDAAHDALAARVQFEDPQSLFFIVERVRTMFDVNADWATIVRTLGVDPAFARQLKSDPGLRVPGCWNAFELATRAILGQQITVAGATTLAGRLVKQFGQGISGSADLTHVFPPPEVLADANLKSIGLTSKRAETIRCLARAVRDGEVTFDAGSELEDFVQRLCDIPGIGKWTAQYVAMRALAEPDAFPSGDLGLMHALKLTSPRELERRSEAWRPWRAYAAMYLWKSGSKNAVPSIAPI
jgi:AraC family transcriptional regulator of adaptative response / DNA-3-methyladenine glycosylase II